MKGEEEGEGSLLTSRQVPLEPSRSEPQRPTPPRSSRPITHRPSLSTQGVPAPGLPRSRTSPSQPA